MKTAIVNARIVNEGIILEGDVIIENDRIAQIGSGLSTENCNVIDAGGKYLIPGVIDSQVHFREPGLTHKAELATETRAAVAGGTTSFFDMPNTKPQAVTQEAEEMKQSISHVLDRVVYHKKHMPEKRGYPASVKRNCVEEFSGESFEYVERLDVYENFVADKKLWEVDAETRALADLCLILINSNEFIYIY